MAVILSRPQSVKSTWDGVRACVLEGDKPSAKPMVTKTHDPILPYRAIASQLIYNFLFPMTLNSYSYMWNVMLKMFTTDADGGLLLHGYQALNCTNKRQFD